MSSMIDCNNCIYLNFTEKEQDLIYFQTGRKPFHICGLYNQRVYHNNIHFKIKEKRIFPCRLCKGIEDFKTRRLKC